MYLNFCSLLGYTAFVYFPFVTKYSLPWLLYSSYPTASTPSINIAPFFLYNFTPASRGVVAMVGGGAGGGSTGESRSFEFTPTWVVAVVSFIIVLISLVVERSLHKLGKVSSLLINNKHTHILYIHIDINKFVERD